MLSGKILIAMVATLFTRREAWRALFDIIRKSGFSVALLKNLGVFPKALYVAGLFAREQVGHVHAHWGSSTSTMAYVASRLNLIPWSMTLHRWDITENNMLPEKADRASFVRCIAIDGFEEFKSIVGEERSKKGHVLHMGVDLPPSSGRTFSRGTRFTICCPANLVPKKGHTYLLKAMALIKSDNSSIRCLIIGDGPLDQQLRREAQQLGLTGQVDFVGRLPHNELLRRYSHREIDAVVLPSIVLDDGEREGIPVSLMEAMAHEVPVISTACGGTWELLQDGAGIIVEQKDPEGLSRAIESLSADSQLYRDVSEAGRLRIEESFSMQSVTTSLTGLMRSSHYEPTAT